MIELTETLLKKNFGIKEDALLLLRKILILKPSQGDLKFLTRSYGFTYLNILEMILSICRNSL